MFADHTSVKPGSENFLTVPVHSLFVRFVKLDWNNSPSLLNSLAILGDDKTMFLEIIDCTILSVTFFKSAGVSAKYTPLVVAVCVPPLISYICKISSCSIIVNDI